MQLVPLVTPDTTDNTKEKVSVIKEHKKRTLNGNARIQLQIAKLAMLIDLLVYKKNTEVDLTLGVHLKGHK